MKTISVGSDFSGVGAFDFAIGRVANAKGFKVKTVFACDMDKFARQTYIHNHGKPDYYPANVYDREIPAESIDVYMTSPPCQAFSISGKRLGKDDKRGILFFNSHEFIQKNNPRFFIFENVRGLISHDNGKTFSEWLNLLAGKSVNGLPVLFPYENAVNYHVYWQVLNAKDHGIPQNRERVFIIGIRDDRDNNFRFPIEEHLSLKFNDILEKKADKKYFLNESLTEKLINGCESMGQQSVLIGDYRTDEGLRWRKDNVSPSILAMMRDTWSETFAGQNPPIISIGKERKNGRAVKQLNQCNESGGKQPYQQNRIYSTDGIAPALLSNLGGDRNHNIFNDYKIRRLTPRECFRLMDFPDTFTWPVPDSQAYKQAGNSIVVRVLEKIITNLHL